MIIPIPIFFREKSKEEKEAEQRFSAHQHSIDLKRKLNEDIEKFKQRFRNKDIWRSPEVFQLYQTFGHTDIDKLSLKELFAVGFISDNVTRGDVDE